MDFFPSSDKIPLSLDIPEDLMEIWETLLEKHRIIEEQIMHHHRSDELMNALAIQAFHGKPVPDKLLPDLVKLGLVNKNGTRIDEIKLLVCQHVIFPSENLDQTGIKGYGWKAYNPQSMRELLAS